MTRESIPEGRRFVVIMPSRDEDRMIGSAIETLANQTIPPAELVIVNDGSTDRTGEIADDAAERYDWVTVVHREDRGVRKLGGGVIDAFNEGMAALRTDDYQYLCKFDADITLPTGYFAWCMDHMDADPELGSVSSKVFGPDEQGNKHYEESIIDDMVAGQVKFYRRECFEDIGGFVAEIMWDGIDFHTCRMKGWKTRSIRDENIYILHHRLMGSSHKNIFVGRLRWGRGQWFMGTHPLYVIASGVFRMRERPFVIGGLLIIAGYFRAWIRGERRYEAGDFRKHLHAWQLKRLRLGFLAPKVDAP